MTYTIGELFAGYGGLGQGVELALGPARTAWVSDVDPGANKILAHRYPDAPNLGDITAVDWTQVEPVDVITGGSPCQDLSHAGKRLGMKAGTRSGLWASMCDAIDIIRPRLVVWENVRGALSAEADSALEPCPGCVGDGDDGPVLRALGRVLGDLADLGYVGGWCGLRAADVGAPHGRFRVFVVAWPAAHPQGDTWGQQHGERLTPADADDLGLERGRAARHGRHGPADSGQRAVTLLPTPAVNDMGAGKTPDAWDAWDAWTERMQAKHGNGNGHGASLEIEALRLLPTPAAADGKRATSSDRAREDHSACTLSEALLPTPRATDGTKGGPNQRGSSGDLMLPSAVTLIPTPKTTDGNDTTDPFHRPERFRRVGDVVRMDTFGKYAPAIARWEAVAGSTAPPPTEPTGKGGAHRLSPAFVEWMMGLPVGWVTDTPGVTRNEALKALGNGVVPQQAAEAVSWVLGQMRGQVAA